MLEDFVESLVDNFYEVEIPCFIEVFRYVFALSFYVFGILFIFFAVAFIITFVIDEIKLFKSKKGGDKHGKDY